ncbi:MAG: hypothetical protein FWE84_05660 [Firmicutes bacterium]|nr:hypothetical protein [Bacillota bacterium]
MILCECTFCIYNRERKCRLQSVRISAAGLCDDCIDFCIDEEAMEKYKKQTLKRVEKRKVCLSGKDSSRSLS